MKLNGSVNTKENDAITEIDRVRLNQYPTPMWVAHALIEQHFSHLEASLPVIEPSCGAGSFLHAIPEAIPAFGVEIDPHLAERARRETGRTVLTGDFAAIALPRVQAIIGNPPFTTATYEMLVQRAADVLIEGGTMGLILPASAIGSASRIMRWFERFSITQHALPRYIYPRIMHPLVFAIFTKEAERRLVGFTLYPEVASIAGLRAKYRRILERSPRPAWRVLVAEALRELGGTASLAQICAVIESRVSVYTRFWRDTIRRVAGEHFIRVTPGVFALAD